DHLAASHPFDEGGTELGGLDLGGAFHEAGEVVGDDLVGDRRLECGDDQVGGFVPPHVAQHHLAGEDHRARVHLVLAGVLGGGAVGRLEDGVAVVVVDVPARGDADAPHLGGESV